MASGDPLFYGIGKFLQQQLPGQIQCHTNTSSVQYACAALGIALQDVEVISLHGRPLSRLKRLLQAGRTLVVIPDKHSHPQALAAMCREAGLSASRLHVCECLGYDTETIRAFSVAELLDTQAGQTQEFDDLHISVLSLAGSGQALGYFPGIPDHQFVTGAASGQGMLTKREVRLTILSILQTGATDVCWDIGAGCGGVAVEWALWHPQSHVYAIEHHAKRLTSLEANRQRFGVVDNLEPVAGRAPAALSSLPAPQRVFVGGE